MKNYLDLMRLVRDCGEFRNDRTGTGTKALFFRNLSFDMDHGFPATTTKKLFFKSVAAELIGFMKGYSDSEQFKELGTSIWHANANADWWQNSPGCNGPNDMGRVYGVQWRDWRSVGTQACSSGGGTIIHDRVNHVDQLLDVLDRLKSNPHDRRLCVTAWNPGETDQMCLPPCHLYFQYFARGDDTLDMFMVMRSVDTFLGMPFDIASYALLLHLSARHVGRKPGMLHMTFGDTHLYSNHSIQVDEQLSRNPRSLPTLWLDPSIKHIDDFSSVEQVKLEDYSYYPPIKAEMAV